MGNIDEFDRKILKELQKDASLSVDTLADKIGLSRNACWRRVKILEESQVIKKRVAIVDPVTIGLEVSAIVMIKTNEHDENWLLKFEKAVKDLPEIVGAHRMSGDLDYVLRVHLASMKDYDRFYKRLISRVPIADISASFVMEDLKDTTELPV